MSKAAILTMVDEEDLGARPWPRKLKDRIWAVRSTKMAQVQSACAGAVQEYFRPPAHEDANTAETRPSTIASQQATKEPPVQRRTTTISPPNNDQQPPAPSYASLFSLSSAPRCPKGSHVCDAANLGWLLLVFNELQLLNRALFPQQQQSLPPPLHPVGLYPNSSTHHAPSRRAHQPTWMPVPFATPRQHYEQPSMIFTIVFRA